MEQQLSDAQRNNLANNPMTQAGFFGTADDLRPHPAEILFKMTSLKDLVMKSDIPEKLVPLISRLLWTAERYTIPARSSMVEWYLLGRLGKERLARREFMEVLMKSRDPNEEEEVT